MDPLFLAHNHLKRRKFDECIDLCSQLLERQPTDQAVWLLKTRALTSKGYIDDTELEDESLASQLMDDNSIAMVARPGTSLRAPLTSSHGAPTPGVRPTSTGGRPLPGFAKPGSASGRPTSSSKDSALMTSRISSARPVTSASGRFVRVGTSSLISEPGGPFIDLSKVNLERYVEHPALAKVLFEYILHQANDVKRALELAALATERADFKDWWWKVQLGKTYYWLALYRDAQMQYESALRSQEMVETYLLLGKVFIRMDNPTRALSTYSKALDSFPGEPALILAQARIYELLNDMPKTIAEFRRSLKFDSSSVEAIASLGSHYFYTDHPEIALRYYRRLLQMGVFNAEIFCNLGLCCFYAQQYDMVSMCFERSLALANDEARADVWYNISHLAIGIGDVGLANQALKLTLACNPSYAEAYSNLGVLEMRNGNQEAAKAYFYTAARLNGHLHEPQFNLAITSYGAGDLQSAFVQVSAALINYPDHFDSKCLLNELEKHFI